MQTFKTLLLTGSLMLFAGQAVAVNGTNAMVDDQDPVMFPQVGAVLFKYSGTDVWAPDVNCTGTLIDHNVVISAGHCVALVEIFTLYGYFEKQAGFSLDPHPITNPDAKIIPIRYQVGHPGLHLNNNLLIVNKGDLNDVSLYILDESIDDVQPKSLPESDDMFTSANLIGEPAWLVGFSPFEGTIIQGQGVTDQDLSEIQRRYGETSIQNVASKVIAAHPDTVHSGVNGNSGDSGSPLILQSDPDTVIGVWSGSGTTNATFKFFTNGHTFTRLDVPELRNWINEVLDAVANDMNPCELGYAHNVLGDKTWCELDLP